MDAGALSSSPLGTIAGGLEHWRTLREGTAKSLRRARYRLTQRAIAAALTPPLAIWHLALERGAPSREARRELVRRFEELLARDLASAEAGEYPAELLFSQPWGRYLRAIPSALPELWRIWHRRRRGAHDELPGSGARYPRYYRRTFHWQTDGWLSTRSARLYDPGVEFLFGGAADLLRRRALPPVAEAVRGLEHPRILDVACGTGRLLAQLAVALPAAKLYGLDLSPWYLAHARRELPVESDVSLVADNAEAMPFRDATFDAAVSVFLFHELPKDARRRVAREAARVLEPGGVLVVCDADQPEPGTVMRPVFERFARLYHEPYFDSYLRDPLPAPLAEAGLEVISDETDFLERVVVARKPG